jgi:hypothetical protein
MKKLYTDQLGFVKVYEDDAGAMYLVVVCAGIVWSHTGIIMNDQERADFLADPSSVHPLAKRICYSFTPFKDRPVPEHLRAQMLD